MPLAHDIYTLSLVGGNVVKYMSVLLVYTMSLKSYGMLLRWKIPKYNNHIAMVKGAMTDTWKYLIISDCSINVWPDSDKVVLYLF